MKQAFPAAMVIILLSLAPLAARAQDSDNDGVGDAMETALGSNPNDAGIFPCSLGYLDVEHLIWENPYYSSDDATPSMAWTGTEFGVLVREGTTLSFFRLSPNGALIGGSGVNMVHTDYTPILSAGLAWSGSEFMGAYLFYYCCTEPEGWVVSSGYSMRISTGGNKLDNRSVFYGSNLPDYENINVKWIGSEWTVFNDDSIYRIAPNGIKFASVSHPYWRNLDLVWTGSEYGAFNKKYNTSPWDFRRLTVTGSVVGADFRIAENVFHKSAVWTGSEYAAIYDRGTSESTTSLWFVRLTPSGERVGSDLQLSPVSRYAKAQNLLWKNGAFLLIWQDNRTGSFESYAALLSSDGTKMISETPLGSTHFSFDRGYDTLIIRYLRSPDFLNRKFYSRLFGFLDGDGDGLVIDQETAEGTNTADWDTDGDLMDDGWEVTFGTVCDIDPLLNDASGDPDHDGMTNLNEYQSKTDPCVPNITDADGDGLSDATEAALGTNPNAWDTDGDGLSDKFEADNATGHDPDQLLDPLDSADGNTADFDGDGIGNAHEYWNGTSLWAANPAGFVECGYWGEADNDGFITGNDRDMLLSASIGNPTDYSNVFPPTGETQDLDGDGWYTGNDVDLLNSMMVGADTSFVQSRPAALEAIDTCAATLAVGDTCHVSVAVLNSMTPTAGRQAGIAVVFTVDPSSTGSATIFGGEGAGDLGAGRYDLSTSALSSPAGVSRAVVRADAAGSVKITARVPRCGTEVGVGRSSSEIVLPAFATVNVP